MINQPPNGEACYKQHNSVVKWSQKSEIRFTVFLNKFSRSQTSENDILGSVFLDN